MTRRPSNNLDGRGRNSESNELLNVLNDSNCPATKTRSVRRVDTTDAFVLRECKNRFAEGIRLPSGI
jgi:hypothetical protein